MTIAALLSDFGINIPRYVTVNGQIVCKGVAATASGGYAHATLGPVTPVPNHTFHGGTEAADEGAADWWDDLRQIQRHIDAMAEAFPNFAYIPAQDDRCPGWVGSIDTGRGRFVVGISMRRDQGLPHVRVLSGGRLGVNFRRRWKPSPHLYVGGNLCVADQDDWLPDLHTAATVTAWAAHWLAAYTEWRMIRRWPVDGVHADVL